MSVIITPHYLKNFLDASENGSIINYKGYLHTSRENNPGTRESRHSESRNSERCLVTEITGIRVFANGIFENTIYVIIAVKYMNAPLSVAFAIHFRLQFYFIISQSFYGGFNFIFKFQTNFPLSVLINQLIVNMQNK